MTPIANPIPTLELAQVGWVIPDIHTTMKFLAESCGVAGFHEPQHIRAKDLGMTYYGSIVDADWLTTQTYSGGVFIELIQPLSGQSMFHDFLNQHAEGGVQHFAFRLPVSEFDRVTAEPRVKGYQVMSEVDHPIARMMFFDTYATMGVATEIMGITPEGWAAIEQMKQSS